MPPITIPVPDFRTYGFGSGNVEVDAFNPCGAVDNRYPVTPVAGVTPDLTWGILRLGLDGPCGVSYDFYRLFFRFPLRGQEGGPPNLPLTTGQALFIFYYRPDIGDLIYPGSGALPARLPICQAVDLTGHFPSGNPAQPGIELPQANPPVVFDYGSTGTIDTNTGKVTVDVTTAYNLAKSLDRDDLWLMLRSGDESDDGLSGARWYAIICTESVNVETRPRLELSEPSLQRVQIAGPLHASATFLEPCVFVSGEQLEHHRDRGDAGGGARPGYIVLARGNVLQLEARILDTWEWPPRAFDPREVYVTLRHKDGTVVLQEAPMSRVDVGHWVRLYRTQQTDPLGLYTAKIRIVP